MTGLTALYFQITLEEPVLLTALSGDPNSAVSLPYVPGSVLRGVAIASWLRQNPLHSEDMAADEGARRLFLNGATRFLNGYPIAPNKVRTLPTPLSWQQRKVDVTLETRELPAPIYNFATNGFERQAAQESGDTWLAANQEFFAPEGTGIYSVSSLRHLAVHTARTPRYGRAMPQDKIEPGEAPGAIFRYDALAAEQTFGAAILCSQEQDAWDLWDLLPEDRYWLGGSRTGGYGCVKFHDHDIGEWREVNSSLEEDDKVGLQELYITLQSDLLLRDSNGQFVVSAEAVRKACEERLGSGARLLLHEVFLREQPVGGFNRKWGLPLPQTLAIRRGSVFVFKATNVTIGQVRSLEEEGIGERRAEGFGRVGVTTEVSWRISVLSKDPEEKSLQQDLTQDTESHAYVLAQRMTDRMLARRIQEQITGHLADTASWTRNGLHNSQIGRLRAVLRDELNKPNPDTRCVTDFLDNLKDRARQQFNGAYSAPQGAGRSQGNSLAGWLRETAAKTSEEAYQGLFRLDEVDYREIGKVKPQVTDALRHRWVLEYMDAALMKLAKSEEE